MDGFKVKEVSAEPEKSKQQIEAELLEKHEQQFEDVDAPKTEEKVVVDEPVSEKEEVATESTEEVEQKELQDTDVLSYIKNRYKDKEINSIDELFEQRESNEELPEDVSTFLKFKKETGRGINDFVKLNKDFDKANPDSLLADYWSETKTHLDSDDIAFELEERFGYDEEMDEESEIRKTKIAKKEELVKAKEYFNKQKELYKLPLESSSDFVSEGEKENYNAYKKYAEESKDSQQQNLKRQEYFLDKTNKLFSDEFKGFEFKVGERELTYKPGNSEQLKKAQSDVTNFISSHVNEDGYLKDANAYHRALSVAMNPEAFAKYFYEQGQSDAIGDVTRESKNVDMPVRKASESVSKGGFKVSAMSEERGSGKLRIRSKKK